MIPIPWFKVDDNLAFHAKTMLAGNAAMGLWVRAGSWASQQLTDGHIPSHIVAALGTQSQASKLVSAGLWDVSADGFQFHQWTERQPKSDAVRAERFAARERMADLRAKKKGVKKTNPQVSGLCSDEQSQSFGDRSEDVRDSFALPDPVPVPVPTRPISKDTPAKPAGAPEGFEAFWDAYGKKVARPVAERAFAKALKKADADTLIHAAKEHLVWQQRCGNAVRFIPNAATWLNQCRWLDERAEPTSQRQPATKADQRMANNIAVVKELQAREQEASNPQRPIGELE